MSFTLNPNDDRLTPDSPTTVRGLTTDAALDPHPLSTACRAAAALAYVTAGVPVLPLYEIRDDGLVRLRPSALRPAG